MTVIQNFSDGEQNSSVRNKINTNFANVKTDLEKMNGFFDYNDLATQTTPINVPANTDVFLTNDEAGPFTLKTYAPSGVTDIWDSSTNAFDFSELSLGDTVDLRLDLLVTTISANQEVNIYIDLGIGQPGAYSLHILGRQFKTAGTYNLTAYYGIYMGDNLTKNNPAKFKVRSDANATVKVNGWYCKVTRQAK